MKCAATVLAIVLALAASVQGAPANASAPITKTSAEWHACVFSTPGTRSAPSLARALDAHVDVDRRVVNGTRAAAFFATRAEATAACAALPPSLDASEETVVSRVAGVVSPDVSTDVSTDVSKARAAGLASSRRCCGFLCLGTCSYYTIDLRCRCKPSCTFRYRYSLYRDYTSAPFSGCGYNRGDGCSVVYRPKFNGVRTVFADIRYASTVNTLRVYNGRGDKVTVQQSCTRPGFTRTSII